MRVLTKIDGSYQVDEIFALSALENGKAILYTAEHLVDIEVSGLGILEHERIAQELLVKGYADLSRFTIKNIEDEEDTNL